MAHRGDRFRRDTSGEPRQPNWRVFWWVIDLSAVFSVVIIAFAMLEEQSCGPGGCW